MRSMRAKPVTLRNHANRNLIGEGQNTIRRFMPLPLGSTRHSGYVAGAMLCASMVQGTAPIT